MTHPSLKMDDIIYDVLVNADIINESNLNIFENGDYDKIRTDIVNYVSLIFDQIDNVVPLSEIDKLILTQSYHLSGSEYLIELTPKINREELDMWGLSFNGS